jgi:hypothetical protein
VQRQIVALTCEHQQIIEEPIEPRDVSAELGVTEFGLAGEDYMLRVFNRLGGGRIRAGRDTLNPSARTWGLLNRNLSRMAVLKRRDEISEC